MEPKVALVTGGAKRVGRAIVEKLAKNGFLVAFTYHSSSEEAHALARKIKGVPIRADLMNPHAAVTDIAEAFGEKFDRLDLLVNNASAYLPGRLRDTTPDLVRKLHGIHVESPLFLAQKFEPLLRQFKGHIVSICDLLTERPWPEYLAYCVSKGGLITLTRALARELAPEVTVNAISPGVVDWPEEYPQADREKYLKRVPLGRAGTPEDVANLVLYLGGGRSYITGQIIALDGGRSIT